MSEIYENKLMKRVCVPTSFQISENYSPKI